jgi:hypothetical protein
LPIDKDGLILPLLKRGIPRNLQTCFESHHIPYCPLLAWDNVLIFFLRSLDLYKQPKHLLVILDHLLVLFPEILPNSDQERWKQKLETRSQRKSLLGLSKRGNEKKLRSPISGHLTTLIPLPVQTTP